MEGIRRTRDCNCFLEVIGYVGGDREGLGGREKVFLGVPKLARMGKRDVFTILAGLRGLIWNHRGTLSRLAS
jgi:hypothetical protein